MSTDLSGNLSLDAAAVHAYAETSRTEGSSFHVFRTILREISTISELNERLAAERPDLRYTFCDPRTFSYLGRTWLGGDNHDIAAYLFDTAPATLEAGKTYVFELAVRNDGWDMWRAGDGANDPRAHRIAVSFSPAETRHGKVTWAALPRDVSPGDAVVVPLTIAPLSPVDRFLFFEMARGETYFSSRGEVHASPLSG